MKMLKLIMLMAKYLCQVLSNTHVHLSQQLGRGISDDVEELINMA